MSWSVGAPPILPSLLLLLVSFSILAPLLGYLWDVRLTKKKVSFVASAHFSLSLLPNLFITMLKKSSGNQKVVVFIPEKEQINRYILYYYAYSSLTPAQFVIRSLLAARNSVVCHRCGWTLLVLLL